MSDPGFLTPPQEMRDESWVQYQPEVEVFTEAAVAGGSPRTVY